MRRQAISGDPLVGLVGGGAIVVAGVASFGTGRVSGAFVAASIAWSLGLLVLALGLPGRVGSSGRFGPSGRPAAPGASGAAGVFGSGLAQRWLIAASAVLPLGSAVVEALAGTFVPVSPATLETQGFRAFSTVLLVVDVTAYGLLVAGAIVVGRSRDASGRARIGLSALALVTVASIVVPNVVVLTVPTNDVQLTADGLFWLSRLLNLATCAVGIWFAWPWLSPRIAAGRAAVGRAHRRYVDSTP